MISLEAPSRKRQKTFQEDNLKLEDKKMLEESVEWDTSHNMIPVTNAGTLRIIEVLELTIPFVRSYSRFE